MRVANLLKQISASVSESATEDQTSDHSAQSSVRREPFDLHISEEPPTPDQLVTMLDYVGKAGIPSVVKGANTTSEALKLYKQNVDNLKRPVVRTVAVLSNAQQANLTRCCCADCRLEQRQGVCRLGGVCDTEDAQCAAAKGLIVSLMILPTFSRLSLGAPEAPPRSLLYDYYDYLDLCFRTLLKFDAEWHLRQSLLACRGCGLER